MTELLVLHAVRLLGMADDDAVARRFGLDRARAAELLLDFEAYGWVTWSEFAGVGGWSLTERGRAENERRLAAELAGIPGGTRRVHDVHEAFLPLNARLQQACTDWQLRPRPGAPLAANTHEDPQWDARVLAELTALSGELVPLVADLTSQLDRFRGYDTRFAAAAKEAAVDACHRVWFELHEDLIATLGLQR